MRYVSLADHLNAHWGKPNVVGGRDCPGRLFHGSHESNIPKILREGLLLSRPGGLTAPGGATFPERAAVYMTSGLPLAREAVRRQHGGAMNGRTLIEALKKPPPRSSWEDASILVVDVWDLPLIKSGEFLSLTAIPASKIVGVYKEMAKKGRLVDDRGHVL